MEGLLQVLGGITLLAHGGLCLLLPRRLRLRAVLLVGAVDLVWALWIRRAAEDVGTAGAWAIPPLAAWLLIHLLLIPALLIEALARVTGRPKPVRLAGAILVLGGYAWGLAEAYGPPVVTEATLRFPDLPPAFDGYRIVLLGDVHAGPFTPQGELDRWVRAAAALRGDLLVGAGDFIAYFPEEAEAPGRAFEALRPPDGKVGVLGNHDRFRTPEEVAVRLRRHGWTMLLDEVQPITRGGDRLLLLGTRHPYGDPAEFKAHWKGRPWPEGFRIGICHGPEQWGVHREVGARLTLAAHTHGGQINLDPIFNLARLRSPYLQGLYEADGAKLVVTRGLGCTGLPFRFRCRPELVALTLRRG